MGATAAGDSQEMHHYECDLPSCSTVSDYEPVEEDDFPPEPPPGWYSVSVTRHASRPVALTYCSHGHMVEGVDEHLPMPPSYPDEVRGWQDRFLLPLFLLGFLAVLILGLVSGVGLLLDLGGWAADRL